ncbi:MAG TPA: argininosuccinate lyase [Candidatus Dormibacteraeota bacterium]
MSKLWGGRFTGSLLPELDRFASSLEQDLELFEYDIAGSIAHARGLHAAGLLTKGQLQAIERGLKRVHAELRSGSFEFAESDEDIHTAVERRLTELAPDAGGRLHAGRSRNDQVATDLRLYCRAACSGLAQRLAVAVAGLAEQGRRYAAAPMPGYTHLQRAQPVTAGHHLLAHAEALLRDADRLRHAYAAADELPLGSGALAGSTLALHREVAQKELGFSRLTENSMDAVADRDFVLDLIHACTVIGLHLSRLAEDLVLWSTSEFGFLKLGDEVSTGSSLMPQKRNPDIAELLRGRSGRALGAYTGLAAVLKGLPLTYDRDLQEDKPHLFLAVDATLDSLEAAALLTQHLELDEKRMAKAAADTDLLATDTAEALVSEGVPFREAHHVVGRQVAAGEHRPPGNAKASLRARGIPSRARARAKTVLATAERLNAWAASHPPKLPL